MPAPLVAWGLAALASFLANVFWTFIEKVVIRRGFKIAMIALLITAHLALLVLLYNALQVAINAAQGLSTGGGFMANGMAMVAAFMPTNFDNALSIIGSLELSAILYFRAVAILNMKAKAID